MKSTVLYQTTFTYENREEWNTAVIRYNCEDMAELEELISEGPTKSGLTGITEYQTGHHGVKVISWSFTKVMFDSVATAKSYRS